MFRGALFFVSMVLSLFSHGKLPQESLAGTSSLVPNLLIAPQLGYVAMQSGWLSNIRFYGVDTIVMKDGRREYSQDTAADPLWQIVKSFFPSVAGTLSAETHHDSNIGTYFQKLDSKKQGEFIGHLVTYTIALRSENPGDAKTTALNSIMGDTFKGPQFQKLRTKKIVPTLLNKIEESVRAEAKSDYPKGITEQVILAFFYDQGKDQEALEGFMEVIHKLVPAETFEIINEKRKSQAQILDDFFHLMLLENAQSDWIMAYKKNDILTQHGDARVYNQRTGQFSPQNFSDCTETALRHFVNLILYDPSKKTFDIPKIPELNNYFRNLVSFYKTQTPALANSSDPHIRSLWNKVVGDMSETVPDSLGPVYYQKGGDLEGHYDLAPGFINMLRVLKLVFNFTLPAKPVPDSVSAGRIYIQEAFQNLIHLLHPGLRVKMEFQELSYEPYDIPRGQEKDFFGTLSFTIQDLAGRSLISFSIENISVHSTASIVMDQSGTPLGSKHLIEKALHTLNLSDTQRSFLPPKSLSSDSFSPRSIFYYLFYQQLSNNTENQIKTFERICENAVHLRHVPHGGLLKNILWWFPYNDPFSSERLSSIALNPLSSFPSPLLDIFYRNLLKIRLVRYKGTSLDLRPYAGLRSIVLRSCLNFQSIELPPNNGVLEELELNNVNLGRLVSSTVFFGQEIDLSTFTALKKIAIKRLPKINRLKFGSKNAVLENIDLFSIAIKELDLSALTALKQISLEGCKTLESLTFGLENVALEFVNLERLDSLKIIYGKERLYALQPHRLLISECPEALALLNKNPIRRRGG